MEIQEGRHWWFPHLFLGIECFIVSPSTSSVYISTSSRSLLSCHMHSRLEALRSSAQLMMDERQAEVPQLLCFSTGIFLKGVCCTILSMMMFQSPMEVLLILLL
jgi:hypothetical protein